MHESCKSERTQIKRNFWIPDGLMESIETKKIFYKKMKTNVLNEEIKNEVNDYNNKLNHIIEQSKYYYYKSKIEMSREKLQQMWNVINEMEFKPQDKETDKLN